jgi:hypothetical protein
MVKPLSTEKALRLYIMLAPYIPNIDTTENGFDFVKSIIQGIVDSGHHKVYLDALALMIGTNVDELLENLNISEALDMFVEGLQINKILDLQKFCEKVGLHG